MNRGTPVWLIVGAVIASPAASAPLLVPFDFTRGAIGIDVVVKGVPLYVIVDTGVDPSLIDLGRADALALKVARDDGGEASGFGDGKGAAVFPTTIDGLAIRGRHFERFDALASDMKPLSDHYGRKLDAVLGFSFLSNKIILLDYPQHVLGILSNTGEAASAVRSCRTRWTTPLKTYDSFPIIPGFRFGDAKGSVSMDTGSNGSIGLFPKALNISAIRASLVEKGTVIRNGTRGQERATSYGLGASVGFGPFTLPAGQAVTVHKTQDAADARLANVGNALFATMKLKVLLDYRGHSMTFYGNCS